MKNISDISSTMLDQVTKKNRIQRIIVCILGCLIIAIAYNIFIVPNNLVTGGVGGLAIIVSKFTGINPVIFIDIVSALLIIVSFLLIGRKKTFHSVFGFAAYAILASLTEPLTDIIKVNLDSYLFTVIIFSIISGLGYGLVYKSGFNTGGMDSLIQISQKYIPVSTTKLSNIFNLIIIVIGAVIFGIPKTIYAIIYLKIVNLVSDKIMLGTSNRKICFIETTKTKDIESYIKDDLELGFTIIKTTNNYLIMCVVPTDRFYTFKHDLLKIDNNCFITTNDCYTVEGGSVNPLIDLTDL